MLTAEGGVVLVLTDENAKTAWLVSRQSLEAPIKAQALAVPVMTVAQAYELWQLPPDGARLSLGLLNEQGGTVLQLTTDLSQLVQPGVGMGVSIEPPGGSPTGAPTGPVVYSGSILSL
jgi:anti-sigma-K factor RskA